MRCNELECPHCGFEADLAPFTVTALQGGVPRSPIKMDEGDGSLASQDLRKKEVSILLLLFL